MGAAPCVAPTCLNIQVLEGYGRVAATAELSPHLLPHEVDEDETSGTAARREKVETRHLT